MLLAGLAVLGLVVRFRTHRNIGFSDFFGVLWQTVLTTAALTGAINTFHFAWTGEVYPGQRIADLQLFLGFIAFLMSAGGIFFYIKQLAKRTHTE